jgi:AraC-like DNA-binding protein
MRFAHETAGGLSGRRRKKVATARACVIKAEIAARLCDSALSINNIAAGQGVTPRYVQMLFEMEGTTFSRFVIDRRLDHAYRLLAGPYQADCSVTAIAFEVGFNDLSYFNRRFRRRFGATPTEVRAAAKRSGTSPTERNGCASASSVDPGVDLAVTSGELYHNVRFYQGRALVEPVTVAGNGEERFVLLSAAEYRRLKRHDRPAPVR